MQRFILVDGNAMLHRAYHAIPVLTKDGEAVNAVYGFFSMILNIIEDVKPVFFAVCFDRPKPTFRQALYVGYQAHRPSVSDDFIPQIKKVHEILEKTGVQIFELDGYEADDLIGTISVEATGKTADVEVIIVSGDRDLLQLVNGRVKMLSPVVGVKQMTLYDAVKVEEKFGITPSQMIDYKALVGDASDGYPGVTGIGPKTASLLLKEFGTFENLYSHLGDVPAKVSEKLAIDAEQASLAKKLATIVTDAPISFDLAPCAIEKFDREKLKETFEKLNFKSLLARLNSDKQKPRKAGSASGRKKDHIEQLGLL